MRYGVTIDAGGPVPDFTEQVRRAAASGIHAVGTSQIFGYDALTLLAVTGQQVPDIELVTAVVPTYPRHPFMLAAQALKVQAAAAERPAPRVMVSLPVSVTGDADAARAQAEETFSLYGRLPSYRAMLDREGAAGPGDVAVVGDEDTVTAQLARFAEAGATDFLAAPFGHRPDRDRTVALIADLAGKS